MGVTGQRMIDSSQNGGAQRYSGHGQVSGLATFPVLPGIETGASKLRSRLFLLPLEHNEL